jgi:hypothetical protein
MPGVAEAGLGGAGSAPAPAPALLLPRSAVAHLPHAAKNVHIQTGYTVHARKREACAALCSVHNETCNIWTVRCREARSSVVARCARGLALVAGRGHASCLFCPPFLLAGTLPNGGGGAGR